MTDIVKVLTHARRLNSATKTLSIEALQSVYTKLGNIIEQRIEAEKEANKLETEKLEKIKKYRQMMAEDGIDPNDLVAEEADKPVKKRAPRPPKYEIVDDNGNKVTWTGQGRMPNVFKSKVDAGVSIDTFLIK